MRKAFFKFIELKMNRIILRAIIWTLMIMATLFTLYIFQSLKKIELVNQNISRYFELDNEIRSIALLVNDSIFLESKKDLYGKVLPGWEGVAVWLENLRSKAILSNIALSYSIDSLAQSVMKSDKLMLITINFNLTSSDSSSSSTITDYIRVLSDDSIVHTRLESIECTGESNGLSKTVVKLSSWIQL